MLNWFSKEFRSFTRQSEGVAALEFAMVFMPVTILILGTLQTVMMMLYSYDLDMATTETVRMFRTGFAQQIGSDSKKMIDTPAELRGCSRLLCRSGTWRASRRDVDQPSRSREWTQTADHTRRGDGCAPGGGPGDAPAFAGAEAAAGLRPGAAAECRRGLLIR